jgi:integrase
MRLTKDSIDKAKLPEPGRKERFIHDDQVRGFGVRITASGAKSFVLEVRVKGRSRRLTLGRWPDLNVIMAREKAQEIRTGIARGEDPHEARLAAKHETTFGELARRYIDEYARPHKKPRSLADDEYCLARYIPRGWHSRRLSDITRTDIERLHVSIGQNHGRYSANHTVRLLRSMFNRAIDWSQCEANPATKLMLFTENKRERYLNAEELQRVNAALLDEPDWRWRAYFPLALMLGTRKNELLTMRWKDIDLAQRTWRIPETKAGNTHLLPLPEPVMEMLIALPSRDQSEWVFPGTGSTGHLTEPKKAWQRIRDRAGVPDVRIHDLRHTLASWLVGQGFSLPLVGRTLNHTQTATTARYAHLALDSVRAALDQNATLMMTTSVSRRKA